MRVIIRVFIRALRPVIVDQLDKNPHPKVAEDATLEWGIFFFRGLARFDR